MSGLFKGSMVQIELQVLEINPGIVRFSIVSWRKKAVALDRLVFVLR